MSRLLPLEPLTREAFAPFGEVIAQEGADSYLINQGSTRRFHALATVQAAGDDACAGISLARGEAFDFPLAIRMLERHPLGSQAWIPMHGAEFVVVVAPDGHGGPDEAGIRAFLATGGQGVNYHAGTWHHPLLTLHRPGDFIIVDRLGPGHNCDEHMLRHECAIQAPC